MITPKVTITNSQQASNAIRKALEEFMTNKSVTVGIHEDAGQHESDDITNASLGAIQEFGTDTIPARPWLNPGALSGSKEYLNIIEKAAASDEPLDMSLNKIGVVAVGLVQKYMTELRTPPNAASTIKKKGSSNPLIDSGALRQSVTYKVTTEKPTEGL